MLAIDEVVHVEELLEFLLFERPTPWWHRVIGRVPWGVPLEGDLCRDFAEGLLTKLAPPMHLMQLPLVDW
ncbi:hypothetical protein GCM10027599_14010 [Yimella radicis]